MKVIFSKEVSGVAKAREVREVADGFALNYLLPQGLAVRATPEKIQALTEQKQAVTKNQERQQEKAQGLAGELNDKTIVLLRPASSTGTLYAAISGEMITQAIKEQLKINILPYQVIVPAHIKTIGQHQVKINLSSQVSVFINLQINAS